METFDYIVVGGGSAGSVVAARLAQHPDRPRVLMLEAGPDTDAHPATLEADGYKETFINDKVFWDRFSTPQQHGGNQRIFMGSGHVLGGSGSVNGMVYTRGAREDYDAWPDGWRWDDLIDDFEALEDTLHLHRREPTQWTEACISAAQASGFRRKDDLNDGDLSNVVGYEWMSYEGDRRRSSYVAFIRDADPPLDHLTVRSSARVHRIIIDADQRATGVEFEYGGSRQQVAATHEIILCAGALETPKLLMLSGVGSGQGLRSLEIPVVVDCPAVGQHLHDHPNVPVFFLGDNAVDCIYPQLYSFYRTLAERPDLVPGQADTCYVFWPAPSAMKQAVQRVLPGMVLPPALYHSRARDWMRGALGSLFDTSWMRNLVSRLYAIVVILGKPRSHGSVRLASADPLVPAIVDPCYLQDPTDLNTLVEGVRKAREIAGSGGLATWGARNVNPMPFQKSDDALAKWVASNVITTYHFAGTCRMGDHPEFVCDTQLRVRGVKNLRVADASVIPYTPVAAINAPSMVIGYRAAQLILAQRHAAESAA